MKRKVSLGSGKHLVGCGKGHVRGWLILGGDARVTNARITQGADSHSKLSAAEAVEATGSSLDGVVPLGNIQLAAIDIPAMSECVSTTPTEEDGFMGTGLMVSGKLSAPLAVAYRIGPFRAPRSVETMPLIGAMPGAAQSDRGAFDLPEIGINQAVIPPGLVSYVGAGSSDLNIVTETAQPTLTPDPSPHWTSLTGFQARRSVVDQAQVQRLAIIAGAAALICGIISGVLIARVIEGGPSARAHNATVATSPSKVFQVRRQPPIRNDPSQSATLSARLVRARAARSSGPRSGD